MTDRESVIIYNMISGIGFVKFNAISNYFGSPAGGLEASIQELDAVRGVGEQLARRIAGWREEIDIAEELDRAERGGARIITILDDDYPGTLRQIPDPPLCLYVAGKLPDFDRAEFIALVGSRRASNYGKRMAAQLAQQAVTAGWGTVSGLAFGIDFAAHDTTVKAGGATVAVLGGGIANIHPREHVPLAREILATGGAIVSEYPMMFPVSRTSFPRRNRIIAALARGVVLIEGAVHSGGLITANLANDYGKAVFAVPGSLDNPMAAGCHHLIKRGEARLVESFLDVIEEFDPTMTGDLFLREAESSYNPSQAAGLDTNEAKVYAYLEENGESSFDAISDAMEFPPGMLSSILAVLEMRFLILQNPGKRYLIRR